MQADYLGQENVSRAIELSKLTKFTISRAGNNGLFTPIFECLDSDSNTNAVEQFNEVAKILNNNITYKITLFDFAEIDTDENGTQKIKKRGGGRDHKKNTFTFILNNTALNYQANQQPTQQNLGVDLANLRADIIKEISKQQEENLILKEINELKKKFAEKFKLNYFPNVIAQDSICDIEMGIGNVICNGNIFTVDISIGNFNAVNLNCTIGHDVRIGNYNQINPAVNISGRVTIGDECLIGVGAIILERLTICSNVIIGAGALVTKDITEPGTYIGIPARKI